MIESDATHLEDLRRATAGALRAAIGPGTEVSLVDVPNQINVGDSLILAGELRYLRRLGLRVSYASDLRGYEARSLRRAMPHGVVLIHGGGNFGDLWIGHQEHREQVVRDLPGYRIVQLPQSVYFNSRERARRANDVLGAHPDFHLLARDAPSVQRSGTDMPDVRVSFCHDMALGWDAPAWSPPAQKPARILVIARADREASSDLATLRPGWLPGAVLDVTDWGDLGDERSRWLQARRRAGAQHRVARYARRVPTLRWPGLQPRVQHNLFELNRANITAGVSLYDTAAGVVVDRLHAHVIAALRGIPHVLLDNSYGKLKAVYDATTQGFSTAHYVSSLEQAREVAATFAGASPVADAN